MDGNSGNRARSSSIARVLEGRVWDPTCDGATAKIYRRGTHRVVLPAVTIAKALAIAPELGVTRIANLTGLDVLGVPVFAVIRPSSLSVSVTSGKGLTLDAARASALMEAIEIAHGEADDSEPTMASLRSLEHAGSAPVCSDFPRDRDSSYRPDAELPWVQAWDLLAGGPTWVPYETVHARYTLPRHRGAGAFQATSNGLASGNCFQEAVLHGLCEIIERDAHTAWGEKCIFPWSREGTRVDPDSITDGECRTLVDRIRGAGFGIALWNLTGVLGVPTFRCDLAAGLGTTHAELRVCTGAGCHPDPGVALARAMTESAQHRVTLISASREDIPDAAYFLAPDARAMRHRQIVFEEPPGCRYDEVASLSSDDVDEDLRRVLARLAGAGLNSVTVVNLSKSRYSIPVVRVGVPGLRDSVGVAGMGSSRRAAAATGDAP